MVHYPLSGRSVWLTTTPTPAEHPQVGHDLSVEVAAAGTATPAAAYFHTNLLFIYIDVSAARSTAVLQADTTTIEERTNRELLRPLSDR